MFGRRKGQLRQEITHSLMETLMRCKNEWMSRKRLIEASIDPSDEVLYQLKLAEARYLFLLKEVREQRSFLNKQRF